MTPRICSVYCQPERILFYVLWAPRKCSVYHHPRFLHPLPLSHCFKIYTKHNKLIKVIFLCTLHIMSLKKLYNLYISGASSALKKSYFYLLPVNTTRTCLVYHHPCLPPFTTESFRYVRRYIVSLKKVSFYILWTPQRCRSVYHRPKKSLFLRPLWTPQTFQVIPHSLVHHPSPLSY